MNWVKTLFGRRPTTEGIGIETRAAVVDARTRLDLVYDELRVLDFDLAIIQRAHHAERELNP